MAIPTMRKLQAMARVSRKFSRLWRLRPIWILSRDANQVVGLQGLRRARVTCFRVGRPVLRQRWEAISAPGSRTSVLSVRSGEGEAGAIGGIEVVSSS